MTHLRRLERRPAAAGADEEAFPFSVPAVRALGALDLDAPVTFFVGENGSGKSTVLEGIAAAAGLPTVGSADLDADETLGAQRQLAAAFRLVWNARVRRGFFLRAEDFFGYTKRLAQERAALRAEIARMSEEMRDASDYARALALGPSRGSLAALESRYGADLDAMSHGQSFLKLFEARFVPGGLYLLDEPEAPLSPQSQLGLLAMMTSMIAQDAQFLVATHSPILLAFPDARIYSFDHSPPSRVDYEELEHVTLTRDFLNAPGRYLRHLGA